MKQKTWLALVLALVLLSGCAAKVYTPTGKATGVETLDQQVTQVLQEVCSTKNTEEQNLLAVYAWVEDALTYRPGTADTSGGITEELRNELAESAISKRKGNCDAEASLMAVLLQAMGYETKLISGQFCNDSNEMVDHTWVMAEIGGQWLHFDPLFGKTYAERAEDYCMADDATMLQNHTWES